MSTPTLADADRVSAAHVLRTTLAATASALIAIACHLPQPWWAVVTAFVVTQSSLGATWNVSRQRLIGSVLGSVLGVLVVVLFAHHVLALVVGSVLAGWICRLLRLSQSAYRFAGVTVAIIAMPHYDHPSWVIAVHRCLEVSIGIITGMAVPAVWRGNP